MKDIFYSPDFHKNELLNILLQKLATPHASPVEALIYYDTVQKKIYFYDGTAWREINSGTITASSVTYDNLGTTLSATTVQAAITEIRTNNPKNNVAATNPTVSNDNTQGYQPLSIWINTAANNAFILIDSATGAAVWKSIAKPAAADVSYDPTGTYLVATTIQAAITELDARLHAVEIIAHTQNTDTGTTSATFQIQSGSAGPKLKNESGVMAIRNAADSDYADIHVKNITIDGEIQEVAGNKVNTGDQEVVLNSDITLNSQNADGRYSVKRLAADNSTRLDAKLVWIESNKRWQAIFGDTVMYQKDIVVKHAEDIGDGAATQFTVTHNLNTRDCHVTVARVASPYDTVDTEVERTSVNAVLVRFNGYTPSNNEFRVIVTG